MGMDGLISVYHSMDDDLPKRIGLADMDGSKYLTFGSAFILAVDSALFPLDTLKTILMSNRVQIA